MKTEQWLLIYPKIPDTYWSFKYAMPFVERKALMPPLGLATIAAMIPNSYDVRIVDMNVEELTDEMLARADLVLVSAMIVQKDSFEDVVARANSLGVPVVAGGPYATSCQADIAGVDYFVLNEGEVTFPRFLADYENGSPRRIYTDATKPSITETPVPRYDLLKMQWYDSVPVQFSRGCPFNCEFCDIVSLFGNRTRTKTPEQFLREMDAAAATGFRGSLFIVDDNFIGNKRKVKELLRHIVSWQREHDYPFALSTEASINLAYDEELLDLMVDAGFTMVFVGIETPCAESLESAGKMQNLKQDLVESIHTIQRRGIDVTGGFIIGFDSDPEDIFDRQIEFIEELSIPTAMVGLLMALPNTRLYDRLKEEGRILSLSSGNNTHDIVINFRTKMPEEVLAAGYKRVIAEVYDPRNYFNRCLALMKRMPSGKNAPKHGSVKMVRPRELRALFRSLVWQTFSPYGLEYVRYVVRGLLINPALVVRMITWAVLGHHYITITNETIARSAESAESGRTRFRKKRSRDRIDWTYGGRAAEAGD
jgi:radical SAM superfamily enzyme YgiQ (UPF0313 family)